jgi:hypothetical protein
MEGQARVFAFVDHHPFFVEARPDLDPIARPRGGARCGERLGDRRAGRRFGTFRPRASLIDEELSGVSRGRHLQGEAEEQERDEGRRPAAHGVTIEPGWRKE